VKRSRRPPAELLLLSASAVAVIYAVGYVVTEPAAGLTAQVLGTPVASARAGRLRDGTYLGEGQNQFGSVYVTVAVFGGRISQVWINSVSTTFPGQVIDGLRSEVVERQSAAVDLVTGATGSSSAFIKAVQAALRQAEVQS